MTEGEFIRFYKKRNHSKSHKIVKEKIDLFWNTLFRALEEDKKMVFKDWGTFEKKEVRARKIITPRMEKTAYTEPKKVIKFRTGLGLMSAVNGNSDIDE